MTRSDSDEQSRVVDPSLLLSCLMDLTNETSFTRGEKYYAQGRVTKYQADHRTISATVVGTDYYQVRIDLNSMIVECNCPVGQQSELICKHGIATLMTYISGVVEPKRTPRVKKKSSAFKPVEGPDPTRLAKIPKAELINRILDLSQINEDCNTYFRVLTEEHNAAFYKTLRTYCKNQINRLKRIRYSDSYWNTMSDATRKIRLKILALHDTVESAIFLLDLGYWITESFLTIDDSDATLQVLVEELTRKSVQYLNNADPDKLEIYFEFIGKPSSFDYPIIVTAAILHTCTNREAVNRVVNKLERVQFKKDPDFAFDPEISLKLLLFYYRDHDPVKYESMLKEYFVTDNEMRLKLFEFLVEQKRYREAVDCAWKIRDDYRVWKSFEESLANIGDIEKLTRFYEERLDSQFSLPVFRKVERLLNSRDPEKWQILCQKYERKKLFYLDKFKLLQYLGKHDRVIEILKQYFHDNPEYYLEMISIEAAKYCFINRDIALILFQWIFDYEFHRLQHTNRYDRFLDIVNKIDFLGEPVDFKKLYDRLLTTYPGKRKLHETIGMYVVD